MSSCLNRSQHWEKIIIYGIGGGTLQYMYMSQIYNINCDEYVISLEYFFAVLARVPVTIEFVYWWSLPPVGDSESPLPFLSALLLYIHWTQITQVINTITMCYQVCLPACLSATSISLLIVAKFSRILCMLTTLLWTEANPVHLLLTWTVYIWTPLADFNSGEIPVYKTATPLQYGIQLPM